MGWFARLVANPDERLRRLNVFALMLALNQLLYAPSLALLAGPEGWRAWPIAGTCPFFVATVWISRRASKAARIWVPLIGIADSLLAQRIMGYDSGGWYFVMPSLTLAALLLRRKERGYLAALTVFSMAIVLLQPDMNGFSAVTAEQVARINAASAVLLTGFIGWLFVRED